MYYLATDSLQLTNAAVVTASSSPGLTIRISTIETLCRCPCRPRCRFQRLFDTIPAVFLYVPTGQLAASAEWVEKVNPAISREIDKRVFLVLSLIIDLAK